MDKPLPNNLHTFACPQKLWVRVSSWVYAVTEDGREPPMMAGHQAYSTPLAKAFDKGQKACNYKAHTYTPIHSPDPTASNLCTGMPMDMAYEDTTRLVWRYKLRYHYHFY